MLHRNRSLAAGAIALAGLAACGGDDDSSISGADWPSYGHDIANTRFNAEETTLSPDNVDKLEKVWVSSDTGVSSFGTTSTPAVVDGVVYFADWEGKLHAVNADDGSSVWSTQLNSQKTGPSAQVNASPFVTDDRVYIGGTDNRIYAVERSTGKKIWDPHALADTQDSVILWSSPVVYEDTLLIGIGSFQVFLPPEYTFRGNLSALDAETGDSLWRAYVQEEGEDRCLGCSIWGSAAIDPERNMAFVGIGQSYSAPASSLSDAVIAVDLDSGETLWGHQFTADDSWTQLGPNSDDPDYDVGASVVLYERGGQAFVGAGDKAGKFYALDRDTGERLWERNLTQGGRTGGVMASPAVADGVIYVVSNDGVEENFGSNGPGASVAFALNGKTGKVLWQTDIDDGVFGGVAIANGLMFFTTLDARIWALDIEDGEVLWTDELGGPGSSAAAGVTVANGMVFAGAGWDWLPLGAPPAGALTAWALP